MKKIIQAGSIVLLTLVTSFIFHIATVKADDSMYLDPEGNLFVNGSITITDNINGGFNIVPVGTILAWHKDLSGVPVLPDGFVEYNGQTLDDADSPLNGQVIADLNSSGRFLRGNNASGTMQDDATARPDNPFVTGIESNPHQHAEGLGSRNGYPGTYGLHS